MEKESLIPIFATLVALANKWTDGPVFLSKIMTVLLMLLALVYCLGFIFAKIARTNYPNVCNRNASIYNLLIGGYLFWLGCQPGYIPMSRYFLLSYAAVIFTLVVIVTSSERGWLRRKTR